MGDTEFELETGTTGISFGALIDDQQLSKREDARLAQDLTPLFNALDRIFTMMRVYPPTHPLVGELVDNLLGRLGKVLEREGSIHFNLDSDALRTLAGTAFFSEELAEKGNFIWYAPYSDGLLQIEFEEGMDADELRGFLRIINLAAQGAIVSDDDTVTLLWELQNDHIHYFAVEGFVDSGSLEDFGERTEKEAVEMIVDAAIDPRSNEASELHQLFDNLNLAHLDLFTKMQIEANAKIIVPELRDQDLAYAFAVDNSLVDKLAEEWTSGADLEYRLIEALLSTIRTAPGSQGAERAAEIIKAVTGQLLEQEMYEEAVRILRLLHDRHELFFDTEFDPLGELIDRLGEPVQIEGLVNLFQLKADLRGAIGDLFLLLGRDVVLRQLLRLLADPDRKVVALGQIMDIVFELVDETTDGLVTDPAFLDTPLYLRRVMSELPDRDFVAWRPTPRLIRKAIESPDPEVRELALQLNHPCWDDSNLAEKYLVPMADDADEGIRKLALAMLGEKHPDAFRAAIRDTVLARKMSGRTHGELRFLMRVFLDSAPDAPDFLREMLDIKGWFGTDGKEFAKMAAAILVETGDQGAIDKIAAARASFFTSPDLKRSYEQILQRFGGSSLSEASVVPEPREEVE